MGFDLISRTGSRSVLFRGARLALRLSASCVAFLVLWAFRPELQCVARANVGSIELSKALASGDTRQLVDAEANLRSAAETGYSRAYRQVAWIRLAEGEAATATELLARSSTLGLDDESAYWQLGWLQWQRGASAEAAEAWKLVVQGSPERLYRMLWILMMAKGPGGDLPRVMIALAEDVVDKSPTQPYPYELLGQMYRHLDYEMSDSWFRATLQRWPNRSQLLMELADNASYQKRFAEARNYLKEALSCDSEDPRLYYLMGRTYEREGALEEVVFWYRKAVELEPSPDRRRALASLYQRTGQIELALAEYEAVLQQLPGDAAVLAEMERLEGLLANDQGRR